MTNTMSPEKFAELTFREVTTGTLDQTPGSPSSLGRKLERALNPDGRVFNSARMGIGQACGLLGCTRSGLGRLLFFCGAPEFPLSHQNKRWPTSRYIVWERMGLLGVMPRFGSQRMPDMIMSVAAANDFYWRNTYGFECYRWRFTETRNDFWLALKEGILCSTEMRNFSRYQSLPFPPKPKGFNT